MSRRKSSRYLWSFSCWHSEEDLLEWGATHYKERFVSREICGYLVGEFSLGSQAAIYLLKRGVGFWCVRRDGDIEPFEFEDNESVMTVIMADMANDNQET